MPALTGHTEMAKEGIRHLGYPDYFGNMLTLFKIIGALVLIIPQIPGRIKEWAYAGFTFDFVAAFISIMAVEGLGGAAFFPIITLAILMGSYMSYHKIHSPDKKYAHN